MCQLVSILLSLQAYLSSIESIKGAFYSFESYEIGSLCRNRISFVICFCGYFFHFFGVNGLRATDWIMTFDGRQTNSGKWSNTIIKGQANPFLCIDNIKFNAVLRTNYWNCVFWNLSHHNHTSTHTSSYGKIAGIELSICLSGLMLLNMLFVSMCIHFMCSINPSRFEKMHSIDIYQQRRKTVGFAVHTSRGKNERHFIEWAKKIYLHLAYLLSGLPTIKRTTHKMWSIWKIEHAAFPVNNNTKTKKSGTERPQRRQTERTHDTTLTTIPIFVLKVRWKQHSTQHIDSDDEQIQFSDKWLSVQKCKGFSLYRTHTHSIYLAIKHSDKVSIELALSFRFKIFKITITTFLIWYVCKVCTFVCESVLYFLFPKVYFIGFIFGIYLSFFFLLSRYRFCPLFRFIWNCMIWSLKFRRLRFVIHKSKITLLTWTHQLFEIVEILLNYYIKKMPTSSKTRMRKCITNRRKLNRAKGIVLSIFLRKRFFFWMIFLFVLVLKSFFFSAIEMLFLARSFYF